MLCFTQPHTLLGSALGLLLVFRTNAAYQRFQEGRKLWEEVLNVSRDIARMTSLYEDGEGRVLRFCSGFLLSTASRMFRVVCQPYISDLALLFFGSYVCTYARVAKRASWRQPARGDQGTRRDDGMAASRLRSRCVVVLYLCLARTALLTLRSSLSVAAVFGRRLVQRIANLLACHAVILQVQPQQVDNGRPCRVWRLSRRC